jgi:hypothetical protein
VKINNAVRTGQIQGFICESFGTIEAIKPADRAEFHANKKPIFKTTTERHGPNLVHVTMTFETDHGLHPGLGENFNEELDEALAIGMKLLSAPYLNQPLPDRFRNNLDMYPPDFFATADYNERFGDVIGAINARGVGEGALVALGKQINDALGNRRPARVSDRELIRAVYDNVCVIGTKKDREAIEQVFAESSDGDIVAAHIAFGNDYLCSDDRGKSSIGPSIFDDENRAWLATTYGVHIRNAQELADLL